MSTGLAESSDVTSSRDTSLPLPRADEMLFISEDPPRTTLGSAGVNSSLQYSEASDSKDTGLPAGPVEALVISKDLPSTTVQSAGARPPLIHSVSLPSQSTSLADTDTSSWAAVLMDRMLSLETRVAEQQRRSEADMARLFTQVWVAI